MSKPTGQCVFCHRKGNLTKSHIWPEWIELILPQTATHHEQIIGEMTTFSPNLKATERWRRVKQGHVGTRKPRNTCESCNGKWMRLIEEAAKPDMPALLLGQPRLLSAAAIKSLAAFLCLVTMRVEASSRQKGAISQAERDYLRLRGEPPDHWRAWIARYEGEQQMDERFSAMHISSTPDIPLDVKYCNSQVTTLVAGQLCAHLFSSRSWTNFIGYEGVELRQIWPIPDSAIEVAFLPMISESTIPWLHEAVARNNPLPARA
jgi:hypothetical protein